MPAREHILHKVRTALGRSADQEPAPAPPALLRVPTLEPAERVRRMMEHFPGKSTLARSAQEVRDWVAAELDGRRAIASRAPLLEDLGIFSLPGVERATADGEEIRRVAVVADLGITTAEYAMCDTGALVVFATSEESRLISLLPPVHITVLRIDRILAGLDELFTLVRDPAALSSSMVLIGGPSRTADIEQILTLGVHGPREIQLVLLDA